MNLITGHVSPQYHVVFDDEFIAVDYFESMEIPTSWETLLKTHVKEQLMSSKIRHGHGTREENIMKLQQTWQMMIIIQTQNASKRGRQIQ